MLPINTVLVNRYKIVATKDHNAIKATYIAHDLQTRVLCVINELHTQDETAIPSAVIRQLANQAEALRTIQYRGLAKVLNHFHLNNAYYIVTEEVKGDPLALLIRAGMPEKEVLHLAKELGITLGYCHVHDVIHRDIRPDNIIIQPDGQPVLVNFGLMKLAYPAGAGTADFIKGWGSLRYSPPEQLSTGTDERSDLYSLGATLYHALTGQTPPPAVDRISGAALALPHVTNSPTHLEAVILKLINLDPAQRYQTAAEFNAALYSPVAVKGAVGLPVTPKLPPSRKLPAILLAIAGIAALFTLVLILVAISTAQPNVPATNAAGALPTLTKTQATPLATATSVPTATSRITAPVRVLEPTTTSTAQLPTSTPRATALATAVVITPTATPTQTTSIVPVKITIGQSALGRPLVAYILGNGAEKRALIGAIHGGYEGNSASLMTKTLEYLVANPTELPPELTLYIVPIANPDGYAAGTDRINGRMNGNKVDLNRNWDYSWGPTATHGTNVVSAGTAPFSEPESRALRDLIMDNNMTAVVFYHSAFTAVFQGAVITKSKTVELAQLMANATGYRYAPEGVPGQITTGDAIDYLSDQGVAAVEVELMNHKDIDWPQNLRGLKAFLRWGLNSAPATLGKCANPYIVQAGDFLTSISEKCDVAMDDLLRLNNLNAEAFLQVGQEIKLR